MALSKETILDVVRPVCPNVETSEHHDQLTLVIPIEDIVEVCRELRDNSLTQFTFLVDITAIDWNRTVGRFEVVYFLQSMAFSGRLRLKVVLPNSVHPHCPTVVEVWEAADWFKGRGGAAWAVGARLDYRFEAQAPVAFHLYYREGLAFVSPVSRESVQEFAGVVAAQAGRRDCLQPNANKYPLCQSCLLYTSPSPRDRTRSRMPSSA